jgi:hypothetical protein
MDKQNSGCAVLLDVHSILGGLSSHTKFPSCVCPQFLSVGHIQNNPIIMKQLEIQDHSEILRHLDNPVGKHECKSLREIWSRYDDTTKYDGYCMCSRTEREEFMEAFKTWFAQMENNLGND